MALRISKIGTWSGHRDSVYALENGVREGEFFSAGADGMVVRWQLDRPDQGELLAKVPSSIYAISKSADSKLLVIGQNFEGIQAIGLETSKSTVSLQLTKKEVFSIAHINGQIWVGAGDGTLAVVKGDAARVSSIVQLSNNRIRSIVQHPSLHKVVIGGSDNKIRVLETNTLETLQTFDAHTNSIFAMAFSPQGDRLLSVGRDAHLRMWDVSNDYKALAPIVAHMYAINHVAFSPSGRYLATCSMDKSVKIWCGHSYTLLKVLDKGRYAGHGTSVNRLLWLGTDDFLVSCSDDRTIAVWQLENII